MLLDIVFKFGTFVSHGGSSENTFWELAKALSFLSVPCALYLYYKKRRDDKKEEEAKKRKISENDLKYFYTVVDDIISDMPEQIESYNKYAELLRTEYYKNHQLLIVSPENLNRIVNKSDQQKLFHSYIEQFSEKERDKAIERFMELYQALDIYLILFNNAITTNTKLNESVSKRINNDYLKFFKENIKPKFDALFEVPDKDPQLHVLMVNINKDCTEASNKTVSVWQKILIERIVSEYKIFKTHLLGRELVNDCQVITSIYSSVLNNSLANAKSIESISVELQKIQKQIIDIIELDSKLLSKGRFVK